MREAEGGMAMGANWHARASCARLPSLWQVSISAFVACTHGMWLSLVGQQLWLVFGLLAFWLNFIPNIGMFTAVCLPMPLTALDPKFEPIQIAAAFFGPMTTGILAKDVLEPIVIGGGAGLQPVVVLLSIMLWGSVWGVTGMVLAVPMTAVCRIYLQATPHPLTRYAAAVMSGMPYQPPEPIELV